MLFHCYDVNILRAHSVVIIKKFQVLVFIVMALSGTLSSTAVAKVSWHIKSPENPLFVHRLVKHTTEQTWNLPCLDGYREKWVNSLCNWRDIAVKLSAWDTGPIFTKREVVFVSDLCKPGPIVERRPPSINRNCRVFKCSNTSSFVSTK